MIPTLQRGLNSQVSSTVGSLARHTFSWIGAGRLCRRLRPRINTTATSTPNWEIETTFSSFLMQPLWNCGGKRDVTPERPTGHPAPDARSAIRTILQLCHTRYPGPALSRIPDSRSAGQATGPPTPQNRLKNRGRSQTDRRGILPTSGPEIFSRRSDRRPAVPADATALPPRPSLTSVRPFRRSPPRGSRRNFIPPEQAFERGVRDGLRFSGFSD